MNLFEALAEGARFELADPLRGLQFSRLARSAAPSPLHITYNPPRGSTNILGGGILLSSISFFPDPLHSAHVLA